jgi:hypothetical protein
MENFMNSKLDWENTKKSFREMLHQDLMSGVFLKAYPELPDVATVETEYDLGRTKCDLVVSHVDHSMSIFECLPAGLEYREYLAAIGHLIHAAVQFSGYQNEVRLFLAVMDKTDADLGFACQAASIVYAPCGSADEHNAVEEVAIKSVASCKWQD